MLDTADSGRARRLHRRRAADHGRPRERRPSRSPSPAPASGAQPLAAGSDHLGDAEELPNQGQASIGDALNDLPSLRSTFSQQNSGRFIGTAGNNFLDLRGLGTTRTLVLVNGRRHVTASAGDFIVDVNTIPQDLLERIDIVTGGESAIYGSDAVAGVVNFVLKRNFDGVRIRGQGGISTYGDRGDYLDPDRGPQLRRRPRQYRGQPLNMPMPVRSTSRSGVISPRPAAS